MQCTKLLCAFIFIEIILKLCVQCAGPVIFHLKHSSSLANMTFVYYFLFIIVIAVMIVYKIKFGPFKVVCRCKTLLHGRTALIVGGNFGVGYETAKNLATRGARVIVANTEFNSEMNTTQHTEHQHIERKDVDLKKFENIKKFASDINKSVERLDILVINCDFLGLEKQISDDGIDMVMQLNYLGPFLLTNLLLNKLIASKPSRIIIVSSHLHQFAELDVDDVAGRRTEGYFQRYVNSKLCSIVWTKALVKRLPSGVTVNSVNPGTVKRELYTRYVLPPTVSETLGIVSAILRNVKEGAQTIIHLCVAPELESATGCYYADCRPIAVSKPAKDEQIIERIWKESMHLTTK